MREKKWLNVLLLVSLVVMIAGCGSSKDKAEPAAASTDTSSAQQADQKSAEEKKPADEGNKLVSSDGSVELIAPEGWKVTNILKDQLMFVVASPKAEKMFYVDAQAKKDFTSDITLESYHKTILDNIEIQSSDLKRSEPNKTTVVSQPALESELTGEVNGQKAQYMISTFEKGSNYYQTGYVVQGEKDADDDTTYKQIMDSLNIVKDSTPVTPDSDGSLFKRTLKSDDGVLSIKVPSNWKQETKLNEEADIQASYTKGEDYLMVLSELKSDIGEEYTMDDYYSVIKDQMLNSVQNAKVEEVGQVEVNGMKGKQFSLSGSVDSIKMSYLVTVVESKQRYNQIIFWTLQNKYIESKKEYQGILQSFSDNSK
ncbi:hypothetical protein Q5741_13120 [Paenibacillus sp. JX-17]|uniref:DUF1795 domain-containing protein n=1 Tax=Paenibacillus lacisoli TaxID=3064525 RepID=A0ABT9CHD8_9BACL|nr:hypothetical protein [Paenibacillus sp. JX-17]MDO7907347.1 hypothetical protein [Paenibacillus sp. JX-17]